MLNIPIEMDGLTKKNLYQQYRILVITDNTFKRN